MSHAKGIASRRRKAEGGRQTTAPLAFGLLLSAFCLLPSSVSAGDEPFDPTRFEAHVAALCKAVQDPAETLAELEAHYAPEHYSGLLY